MVLGDGTGTSDSNWARVSTGEYVVNARQTAKFKNTLAAINSGKAPRLGGSLPNTIASSIAASTINNKGGTDARQDNRAVNVNVVAKDADSFRRSKSQILSDANVHLQRMSTRNG
jgi:hypothetical protein